MTEVLVVSEKFWPEGGGGELATNLILDLLSQSGKMRFNVVSGTKNPDLSRAIRYIWTPLLDCSNKIQLWINSNRLFKKNWFKKFLISADVVYIPGYYYLLVPFAKEHNKQVIVHLHDYQPISYNAAVFPYFSGRNFFDKFKEEVRFELLKYGSTRRALVGGMLTPINKLSRRWISQADKLICVSKRQAEIILREAPELFSKMEVIYNPAPSIPVKQRNDHKVRNFFLYTGGDDPLKGINVLATSLAQLIGDHSFSCTLTKIKEEKWKRYFHKLASKSSCNFYTYGKIPHQKLADIRLKATALLFPSIWEEPLPYTVLEAMLSGTIPIASRVGGVPEIVEGTYAKKMLFEQGDANALTERIKTVLSLSSDELQEIGSELKRNTKDKFNPEKTEDKLLSIFT